METYALLSLGALVALVTCLTVWRQTGRNVSNGPVTQNLNISVNEKSLRPKVFIPNTLARWPWPRRINPHHDVVTKESAAWLEAFGAFSPKAQYAFNCCKHAHLASLTYPTAKKAHFRTCCDFMNLTFFIDEHSDTAEPSEVRKQKDIMMDALRNPHKPRPEGEWVGGEVARQFWELTIRDASEQSQKRFIETFEMFLGAVLQQAIDRNGHHIRDVESYLNVRRNTIGMRPAFALIELGLDIPDEVISHPAIQEMATASIDMVSIDNDLTSYNIEQSRGDDGHNIVTIIMKEVGTDVNGAMLWTQDFHTKLEQKFHAAMAALPEWEEPLKSQVKEYCDGLAQWVRGYDDWQFESERYLGKKGPEIREKRWVSLLPKRHRDSAAEIGPVLVDGSLL